MKSVGLRAAARLLQPVILFFSAFLLLTGHDSPGGGFVGGLTAASALVLHAVAFGPRSARRALGVPAESLAAAGLGLAVLVALAPMMVGMPALTPLWTSATLGEPSPVHLGTPLLFDAGIYLLVAGSALTIVFTLSEE